MEKVSRFQSFRVSGLSTEAFFEHRSFSEGVGEGGVSEFQGLASPSSPSAWFRVVCKGCQVLKILES